MKLKVEELRVGNFLECKGTSSGGLPDNIISVTANGIDKFNKGILHFKPIKLTDEWLKRFGFYRYNNAWCDFTDNNTEFSIWNPVGDTEYRLNDSMICPQIVTVHQLQNLYYWVCEKELKLITLTPEMSANPK